MKRLFAVLAILLWAGSAHAQVERFTPTGYSLTPLSANTGSATEAIPNGTVSVLTQNVGSNGVYCQTGPTATTDAVYLAASGGAYVFLMQGGNQISCITASNSTTVNFTPGSGYSVVVSGGGGGSGGGGSSTTNVTQWASTNVATPTTWGTAPTGTNNIPGVNDNVVACGVCTTGVATPANSSPVVQATATHASVTALGTSLVAKASAGNLLGFYCSAITGGAAGYCIAYNGTTAPGTGALTGANVLDSCYFSTSAQGCSLSRIPSGVAYSTGIVILVSSAVTPFTYTTGVDTAFIAADVQ